MPIDDTCTQVMNAANEAQRALNELYAQERRAAYLAAIDEFTQYNPTQNFDIGEVNGRPAARQRTVCTP